MEVEIHKLRRNPRSDILGFGTEEKEAEVEGNSPDSQPKSPISRKNSFSISKGLSYLKIVVSLRRLRSITPLDKRLLQLEFGKKKVLT